MFNNNLLMGAASAGGANLVSIDNSALFDASASTDGLSYTTDGSGFNQKTFTLSTWFYLGSSTASIGGVGWPIFASDHGSANSETTWWKVRINTNGTLVISNWNDVTTTQVFRDIGWYNLVIGADTTQVAAAERYRVYINGERITSFSSTGYPSQNIDLAWGEPSEDHWIGNYDNANYAYNGYLAETVFKSGSQLGPESFGEFDSTGTFWTPLSSTAILASSPTFYLDNATNPQTDASGNGNNFTNNGSIVTTTHTPSNIFAVFSPLTADTNATVNSLSDGNYTAALGGSKAAMVTLPVDITDSNGFYAEFTLDVVGNTPMVNLYANEDAGNSTTISQGGQSSSNPSSISFRADSGSVWKGGTETTGYGSTWETAGKVIGIKMKAGSLRFEIDGVDQGEAYSGLTGSFFVGCCNNTASAPNPTFSVNTGRDDWEHDPGSTYKDINTTTIASGITRTKSNLEEYFDTTLYEGNGAIQRVGQFLPFTNSFTVANSALFNSANEEYFSRTFETPTDQDVWSLSWWMKTGNVGDIPRGIIGGATHNKDLIYVTTTAIYIAFNGVIDYQIDVDDPSSFHHYYLTNNSGTLTFYIDGVSQGTASAPTQTDFNSAVAHTIGAYNGDANWFDGYMSQFVFVDGTVIALSAFGQVDTSTGRWVPKDVTTTLDEASDFGNNGFFLNFAASDDMGNDVSGNNHDFTNNNTVVQVSDTPTVNFATLDPNKMGSGLVPSNGNRTLNAKASSAWAVIYGTIPMRSGKWYWECHVLSAASDGVMYGVTNPNTAITHNTSAGDNYYNYSAYGTLYGPTAFKIGSWTTTTFTTGDKIGIAVDMDNGYIYFAKNNTWLMSSDPTTATGTGAAFSIGHEPILFPIVNQYLSYGTNVQFDSSLWSYSAPTDYLALSQDNMPTGESYQTAFSWIKNRDATDNHMLFDRVRGIYNDMHSSATDAQVTNVNTLQRFLNGGVQVGNDVQVNTASESYVAWNWYMETTGTGTSNTDGTINTTATLVDTNIGLSISTYTGTGGNATVGHGLGVAPEMLFVKRTDATSGWYMQNSNLLATQFMQLNALDAVAANATVWNSTFPTSTVFNIGTNAVTNASSATYLALCFAPSQFTSIGTYEGNANANGTFVPTVNSLGIPIQPKFILQRNVDGAFHWQMYDTSRSPTNVIDASLYANSTSAEVSGNSANSLDIVTGGFKCRGTGDPNRSNTSIYLAFGTPIIDVDGRIITGR